ncbi:MAG: riboflavin synthase [Microscillaceae bacterium]|nr:riboflavin synthase [Microscillaceae bacterium]MDW8460718.1 riboflavin synthase [Cytophagales bacterium]
MFTGIIETLGIVKSIESQATNRIFGIQSSISAELKIDQSVAHNGVCLTVVGIENQIHFVTAIQETLQKTNLSTWKIGSLINLERSVPANGRFDGHIVQGHTDQIGTCIERIDRNGSWIFTFQYNPQLGNITVEKGSIAVNGVSLTVVNSQIDRFSVAIIPYTFEHTNFQQINIGDIVNLEFDIIGKYVQRLLKGYL